MNTKLLRQKILDLAIRGKLTDQRKSDGTAADLLKEIAAESPSLRPSKRGSNPQQKEITPLDKSEAPFEIPDNWEWVKLGDVAYIASGSTPSKDCFVESGVPYLKMYNLRNQQIDFEYKPQYIKREIHEGKLARSKAKPGDVIMNIVGPPLGKVALVPESLPECNFNQAAVLIRAHFCTNLVNQYIRYFLLQMDEINAINTKGTAGQENISLTQTQNMRLPLPPLAEQQRIVAKIEEAFAEIEAVEKNKELLKTHIKQTRQKILDLAIHGKLVPQDENDEPASVLLEKILQEKAQSDNKRSLKKRKTSEIATSDNRPYEKFDCIEEPEASIPSKWTSCFLGDVISVINGKNQSAVENADGLYPIYGSGGIMGRADNYLCPENCTIIGRKGSINNPIFVSEKFWNVDTAFGLCPSRAILAKYLFFFCLHFDFSCLDSSTTLPSLTKTNIQQIKIILPPLTEQKRIVDKVDELFKSLDEISLHLI